MIEVEASLRNLYRTYVFRMRPDSKKKLSKIDQLRFLGGMESLLQVLGKIPSGIIWDLQITRKKFLFISYTSKESYSDFILRHCDELITNSSNTPCHRI